MSETPEALRRFDALIAAIALAHERVYDLRRALVVAGRATARADALLSESAAIATVQAPSVGATMRLLSDGWHTRSLLKPGLAEDSAAELETEFARIEPSLRRLLARQIEIVGELRAALGEER